MPGTGFRVTLLLGCPTKSGFLRRGCLSVSCWPDLARGVTGVPRPDPPSPTLPLPADLHWATVTDVKTTAVKEFVERQPFRPIALRLSNGRQYTFKEPRDFGAPRSCRELFYFGASGGWVLIDAENITEIVESHAAQGS